MFCTNCGEKTEDGNKFCGKCGTAMMLQADLGEEHSVEKTVLSEDKIHEIDKLENSEIRKNEYQYDENVFRKLVGNNGDYYSDKFLQVQSGATPFNWSIFLLGPFALMYRKKYQEVINLLIPQLIISGFAILLGYSALIADKSNGGNASLFYASAILTAIAALYPIAYCAFVAKKFNERYYKHLKKCVEYHDINSDNVEQKLLDPDVRKKTGTSAYAVVGYIIIIIAISIGIQLEGPQLIANAMNTQTVENPDTTEANVPVDGSSNTEVPLPQDNQNANVDTSKEEDLLTYSNDQYGYQIKYPKAWGTCVESASGDGGNLYDGELGHSAVYASNMVDNPDFQSYLNEYYDGWEGKKIDVKGADVAYKLEYTGEESFQFAIVAYKNETIYTYVVVRRFSNSEADMAKLEKFGAESEKIIPEFIVY